MLLSACSFSKYYYNTGDTDTAIGVAVNRLKSNSKLWREAIVLEKAYNEAFDKDWSRINYLKKEGNPDCWMEVYDLYSAINRRQNLVMPLLPLFIKKEYRNANIKIIDIDAEIIESKRKAADYLYNHAQKLMSQNDKLAYRKAYDEFNALKTYFTSYKDATTLQQTCYEKGQNHISITYKNNSNLILPKDFEKAILEINPEQYNSTWQKFSINLSPEQKADYVITINLRDVNISPEQLKEREYIEEKTIEDGWYYALDSKGNVKKDSLGNDIKIKKYSNIRCVIKESVQNKQGSITGSIDFFRNNKNATNNLSLIHSIPYNENLIFSNIYAAFQGDERAMTPESRRKIGGKPLPFPSNLQMVMDANNLLKARLSDAIRGQINLLNN